MATRVFLLSLASLALSQSEVAGNIGASAPYGIPADTFANLTFNPTLQGTFPFGGYNISNSTYQQISGWQLNVAVTADVPLADAQAAGIDTSKVTETTVLSLLAPASVTTFDEKSWKVCAVVFPYANMTQQSNGTSNNITRAVENCSLFLSAECRQAIFNIAGIASANNCADMSLPSSCAPYFSNNTGSTSFFIDGDTMEDGRFYAWGSEPTNAKNQSAIAAAEKQGWPVIMSWEYDGGAYSFFTCVQASSGNSTAPSGTSHPTPSASSRNTAQVWSVMLAVVIAVFYF